MRFSLHRHFLTYADGTQVFTALSGRVAGLEELYLHVAWRGGEAWGEARANIEYATGVAADRVPGLIAEAARELADMRKPEDALQRLGASAAQAMARNVIECALLDATAHDAPVHRLLSKPSRPDGGVRRQGRRTVGEGGACQQRPERTPRRRLQPVHLRRHDTRRSRRARGALRGRRFPQDQGRLGVEPLETEAIRLRAIRDAVGADVSLAVDANGTWSVEESVARLSLLDGVALDYVEQPTAPRDWTAMAAVHAKTGLPIMADEGLATADDIEALMRLGPPFLAHLKLPKAGGPRALVAQARALQAAGIAVMVGQMNEGALATAAAVQCVLAVMPEHAELYGAYGIADDPAHGLTYRDGAACLAEPAGMGVRFDPSALAPPLWTIGAP